MFLHSYIEDHKVWSNSVIWDSVLKRAIETSTKKEQKEHQIGDRLKESFGKFASMFKEPKLEVRDHQQQ